MNDMAIAAPLPSTYAAALAALLKSGADPLRLEVLRLLKNDSFGVLELSHLLACTQSGMSHHLKILANAGLISRRREGNSIYYRRTAGEPGELAALRQALFDAADHLPLDADTSARWQQVQDERAAQSRAFFAEHADHFHTQQEQVADYSLYGPHAAELIRQLCPPGAAAIEVGPGEGAFLAELAPRFQRVIALDNSREMLHKARLFAAASGLDNVVFVHGDTRDPALPPGGADCIAVNMVLHHIPSPAAVIADLAALTAPDGQLFITDLCHHDQSWTRDACGDIWLGFDPDDLTRWAAAAQLAEGQSVYLAQRNGFRVQIRQFINSR